MSDRLYLDSNNAKFERAGLTYLNITLFSGEKLEHVEPRRLFPISGSDKYISILDDNLDEVALIRDMNTITKEDRDIINDCLNEYYLIPKITKINDITDKFGKVVLHVETNRGSRDVEIRNIVHQIKLIQETRVLIKDWDDNRYEIPDINLLDKKSRQKLDFYL